MTGDDKLLSENEEMKAVTVTVGNGDRSLPLQSDVLRVVVFEEQ
jgi:hypothetical protein